MAAMQGYNPDNGFDPKNFNSTGFHPEPPKQEGFKPNDGFNSSGFSNNIEAPKQEGFKSNNDFNSTGFYPSAPDQGSKEVKVDPEYIEALRDAINRTKDGLEAAENVLKKMEAAGKVNDNNGF